MGSEGGDWNRFRKLRGDPRAGPRARPLLLFFGLSGLEGHRDDGSTALTVAHLELAAHAIGAVPHRAQAEALAACQRGVGDADAVVADGEHHVIARAGEADLDGLRAAVAGRVGERLLRDPVEVRRVLARRRGDGRVALE